MNWARSVWSYPRVWVYETLAMRNFRSSGRRTRWALLAFTGVVLLAGCTGDSDDAQRSGVGEPNIVQAGAPGEPSTRLSEGDVADEHVAQLVEPRARVEQGFFGFYGRAEVIALSIVAAHLLQGLRRSRRLDDLGNGLEAQARGDLNHRSHDAALRQIAFGTRAIDERAVDLHVVEWEQLQMVE